MHCYLLKKEQLLDENIFEEDYNRMYFTGNCSCPFPRLNRTDPSVEERIINLMDKPEWTEKDVLDILAWKTGAIKEYNSAQEVFVYTKNTYYNSADDYCLTPPGRAMITNKKDDKEPFMSFCRYISSNKRELSSFANRDDYMIAFEKMQRESPKGIGTVYLITLLFFLSKGDLPIYDRFVNAAMVALTEDYSPCSEIPIVEPPAKNVLNKVKKFYNDFIKTIGDKDTFDYYRRISIDEKRKIDRALWVYGHYFRV